MEVIRSTPPPLGDSPTELFSEEEQEDGLMDSEEIWTNILSVVGRTKRRTLHQVDEQEVYVNCRGTFGVATAAFWWGRVAGVIFRFLRKVIRANSPFYLLFADDGSVFTSGEAYQKVLLALLFYLENYLEILEVPLSWERPGEGLRWSG